MKFYEKHPDQNFRQYPCKGDEIFRIKIVQECSMCKDRTGWASVCMHGAPVCSDECLEALWQEYFKELAS